MTFRIWSFLPAPIKPVLDGPGDGRNIPYSIAWARRYYPTPGGQNYSLSTQQLTRQTASGPLNIIPHPFRPLEPAPAIDHRAISNYSASHSDYVTGQMFSQPLVNTDFNGFTQALIPINARPFNTNGILAAGKA